MVHFGPNPVPDTRAGEIYEISHGRASILFVLLAGIGISFLYRSARRNQAVLGRAQILTRAAILLPLGLWLQGLDHGVLVILQFYAMYFAFAAILVGFSNRVLLVAGIAFLALGPVAYEAAEVRWPAWFADHAPELGDPIDKIARDLLISGYYPLITWAAPLTIGMWFGRQRLSSLSFKWGMVAIGAVLTAASSLIAEAASGSQFAIVLSNDPHSQNHLWMIGAIGSAMLVLGLALLVSDVSGRTLWPLAAAGQLALTIYVGHLLLLDSYTDLLRYDTVRGAAYSVALFTTFAIVASTLWRMVFAHGPLEAVFRAPSWIFNQFAGDKR